MSNKALVIDDNFYNRALARLVLEYADYTVTEGENGVAALQLLAHKTYHVLVLDLMLPELDGMGVLAEIRKSNDHSPMKVIIMTGRPELATAVRSDVDYVMSKPIDVQIFRTVLRSLKSSQTAVC